MDRNRQVKIIIGLYHGTQPLFHGSIMESRSVDTLNPDWQQEIKYDITLLNLPPASKLCCSIHFHRRRTSLLISVRLPGLFRKEINEGMNLG